MEVFKLFVKKEVIKKGKKIKEYSIQLISKRLSPQQENNK
jgi:hypothetical protein